MKKKSLSPRSITVFKIWITFIMGIVSFLSGIIAAFNIYVSIIVIIISLILYCYIMFFYCKQRYDNEHYSISLEKIYREKGVFFKKEATISVDKIQCIKIVSEPISKFFGLCTLVFYTSGTNEKIPLIPLEEAESITESLQVKVKNEM